MTTVLYSSHKGGKPLMIGMNHAKRMARRMDRRDQTAVLAQMGPGFPRQHSHHQRLIEQRHVAIRDREEAYREQLHALRSDPKAGGYVGAIPQPPAGANPV